MSGATKYIKLWAKGSGLGASGPEPKAPSPELEAFMSQTKARVGIFGGSGFYELLKEAREIEVITRHGKPSDKITLGTIEGKSVAFLPRHGKKHQYLPHNIPYLANLAAFKKLGVDFIVAPSAAGSLQPNIHPGDFVLCDQFVDRTYGRSSTFYLKSKRGLVAHTPMAEPYCRELRQLVAKTCDKLNISYHSQGTMVVIEGPRFSTKAESRWFSQMGWQVVGMTGYPEVALARELGMCYANISLITDYDAGLEGDASIKPVTYDEVLKVFSENIDKVKKVIFETVKNMPTERVCACCGPEKESTP